MTYDDKFRDIVKYVEMNVNDKGIRLKMKDKEDLRSYLDKLNRDEERKGNIPRLSRDFVNKVIGTKRASSFFPHVFGRFGKQTEQKEFRRGDVTVRPQKISLSDDQMIEKRVLRERGLIAYLLSNNRLAYDDTIRRKGNYVHSLRDTKTGQFAKKTGARKV